MNKTLKMVLAAAGALVLGGLGEGIGAELLKKAAKSDDDAENKTEIEDIAVEESVDVDVEEVTDESTED